ncbi:hypothetical protein NL676_017633 [Syzygium grande]|nr:hypothetical protein NL676_017633 [Syzygium grande]
MSGRAMFPCAPTDGPPRADKQWRVATWGCGGEERNGRVESRISCRRWERNGADGVRVGRRVSVVHWSGGCVGRTARWGDILEVSLEATFLPAE